MAVTPAAVVAAAAAADAGPWAGVGLVLIKEPAGSAAAAPAAAAAFCCGSLVAEQHEAHHPVQAHAVT